MFAQTKMEALYTLTLFLDHFTFTQMQSKGIFFFCNIGRVLAISKLICSIERLGKRSFLCS